MQVINFLDDVCSGKATLDDIDHYIEKWHNSYTAMSLAEYLGMTEEQYSLWLQDNQKINQFLSERQATRAKYGDVLLCQNCAQRPADRQWAGENGNALSITHGMVQSWCQLCVIEAQLKYAKQQAKRIPELEQQLEDLKQNSD